MCSSGQDGTKSAVMLRLMNQVDEENMKVFFINQPRAASLLSNVREGELFCLEQQLDSYIGSDLAFIN